MQTEIELTARLFATVLAIKTAGFFVTFTYHSETDENTSHQACSIIQVYRSHDSYMNDDAPIFSAIPEASTFDLIRQQLVQVTGVIAP